MDNNPKHPRCQQCNGTDMVVRTLDPDRVSAMTPINNVDTIKTFPPECRGTTMSAQQNSIDAVLVERGSRYGAFTGHASITQELKRVMHNSPQWQDMSDDKREALEMVMHKIGRILNGDPDYKDSWTDIIGYARLVENTLSD